MKKLLLVLLALVISAAVLVACGDKPESTTTAGTTTTKAPATTTTPVVTTTTPVVTTTTPVVTTTTPVVTTTAPVTTAPVTTAPVTTAPVTTAPMTTAPVTTAPVTTAPVTTAPVTTAPVTTAPTTPDIDPSNAICINTIDGVDAHVYAFEKPSEFGGPIGLIYYFEDKATNHHVTMADAINNGGYAVVSIDGELYTVEQYANGAPWFRLNVETPGATILSGLTYEIIVYVYNADGTMLYYTNAESLSSVLSTANAPDRTPLNVSLPANATKIPVKADSYATEGISTWGDGVIANLFDGDTVGTKLGGGASGTVTVTFSLDAATAITYYTLYTGGDTASYADRNPSAWTLYGEVNGEWVELSVVTSTATHIPGLGATNSTPYSYKIDNPQECANYKIVFTTGGTLQLNEMEVYTGQDETVPDYSNRMELFYHDTFSIDANGKIRYTFKSDNMPFNDVVGEDGVTVRGVSQTSLAGIYINGKKVNASDYYTQDWYIVGATIDYDFVGGETYEILVLIDAEDTTGTYCNNAAGYFFTGTYTAPKDIVADRTAMNPHMPTEFAGNAMTFYLSSQGQFVDANGNHGISFTEYNTAYINGEEVEATAYATEAHWIIKITFDYEFVSGTTYEILVLIDATDTTGTYCTNAAGYYIELTYTAA